ncbi:MAG: DUF998 domain-containing protein [Flammeovirgaceae bacterium]|nr:MAG: DUF998 domain-containing protein [Flammeovirgaceae bacterium]
MTKKQYAILGLLGPVTFWLTYLIMSSIRPEYNFLTKAVSELGSLDAPNKWTWNILGYILTGLLISIYSYGLFKSISNGQGSKLPLISFVLSGLFMSFSGLFPGDFDNKQSTTMLLHTIGSFGSYIFFLIGAFTYPRQMKKTDYWKQSIKPTLTFTWLTIIFGAWPFIFPNTPALGQRLVFFFYLLWIFYTALRLYKKTEPNASR